MNFSTSSAMFTVVSLLSSTNALMLSKKSFSQQHTTPPNSHSSEEAMENLLHQRLLNMNLAGDVAVNQEMIECTKEAISHEFTQVDEMGFVTLDVEKLFRELDAIMNGSGSEDGREEDTENNSQINIVENGNDVSFPSTNVARERDMEMYGTTGEAGTVDLINDLVSLTTSAQSQLDNSISSNPSGQSLDDNGPVDESLRLLREQILNNIRFECSDYDDSKPHFVLRNVEALQNLEILRNLFTSWIGEHASEIKLRDMLYAISGHAWYFDPAVFNCDRRIVIQVSSAETLERLEYHTSKNLLRIPAKFLYIVDINGFRSLLSATDEPDAVFFPSYKNAMFRPSFLDHLADREVYPFSIAIVREMKRVLMENMFFRFHNYGNDGAALETRGNCRRNLFSNKFEISVDANGNVVSECGTEFADQAVYADARNMILRLRELFVSWLENLPETMANTMESIRLLKNFVKISDESCSVEKFYPVPKVVRQNAETEYKSIMDTETEYDFRRNPITLMITIDENNLDTVQIGHRIMVMPMGKMDYHFENAKNFDDYMRSVIDCGLFGMEVRLS